MHVNTGSVDEERRIAIDAAVELTNAIERAGTDGGAELQQILVDRAYTRAPAATGDDMAALVTRFAPVAEIVRSLPTAELSEAVTAINAELSNYDVEPAMYAHHDGPLHIHWTADDADFADQVVVDVLMALVDVICDEGLERFGRCGADTCSDVFFDPTKNHSRRFCSDPKCSSRTHTAEYRARQKRRA